MEHELDVLLPGIRSQLSMCRKLIPATLGMVRFTDSYRYIRINIYDVVASTDVHQLKYLDELLRCIVYKLSASIKKRLVSIFKMN